MTKVISDEDLQKMHDRQANELRQVPEEDRWVVLDRAHFLVNTTPGEILSGALYRARRQYEYLGSESLLQKTREENAHLMGWPE